MFFKYTATTERYTDLHTLVLHDALPICWDVIAVARRRPEVFSNRAFTHLPVDLRDAAACQAAFGGLGQISHVVYAAVYETPTLIRSEEHTSELQSLMRTSYAVFCLKKKMNSRLNQYEISHE